MNFFLKALKKQSSQKVSILRTQYLKNILINQAEIFLGVHTTELYAQQNFQLELLSRSYFIDQAKIMILGNFGVSYLVTRKG